MKNSSKAEAAQADDPFVGINFGLLTQHLPRQSVRWCHLSFTLLSLTIPDALRPLDVPSLSQFLEVIYWRAHGKITNEEFTILHQEWQNLFDKPLDPAPSNIKPSVNGPNNASIASATKKKAVVNINVFRCILLERKLQEADLDLFIGILIHENNNKLLNQTISFGHKKFSRSILYNSLEVVTTRWLSLSEELFFTLDTPGYGSLRFEEAFFFMASLVIGRRKWISEEELEGELSLPHLSALTVQFIRDANAQDTKERSYSMSKSVPSRLKRGNNNKYEVNLICFKRYLMKKAIGEQELSQLIQQTKHTVDMVIKLAKINQVDELYCACQTFELRGSVGCPRLYQESILIASGYAPGPSLPPILLFLLSDSERSIYSTVRAIDFSCNEEEGFTLDPYPGITRPFPWPSDTTNPFHSPTAANVELHENLTRLYTSFKKWSQDNANAGKGKEVLFSSQDIQFDPVYKLLQTSLCVYKRLQGLLVAALFDMAMNLESKKEDLLEGLCSVLLPSPMDVLVEFGIGNNNAINNNNNSSNGNMFGVAHDDQKLLVDDLSHTSSTMPYSPFPAPSEDDIHSVLSSNKKNIAVEEVSQSSLRISNMNIANKRGKEKHTTPNYFKPTSTYLAKTNKREAEKDEEKEIIEDNNPPPPPPPSHPPLISSQKPKKANSIEKEALKADWKAILDVRSKNTPKSSATESKEQSNMSRSVSNESLIGMNESDLVNMLLNTNDLMEQAHIIERLKNLKLQSPSMLNNSIMRNSREGNQSAPDEKEENNNSKQRFQPTLPSHSYPSANSNNTTPTTHSSQQNFHSPPSPPYYNTTHARPPPPAAALFEDVLQNGGSIRSDAASSSTMPSSIAELLQQGHSPGKYAAMLREILRKMSRDDSHVRIKSLEQVLQLGQEIVKKETTGNVSSPIPQRVSPGRQVRQEAYQSTHIEYVSSNGQNGHNNAVGVARKSTAPGSQPDKQMKKPKKAFGHPV